MGGGKGEVAGGGVEVGFGKLGLEGALLAGGGELVLVRVVERRGVALGHVAGAHTTEQV